MLISGKIIAAKYYVAQKICKFCHSDIVKYHFSLNACSLGSNKFITWKNLYIPSKFDAAYTEDSDECSEKDEAGDGEDGDLHGPEPASPLIPPQHDLPHTHPLQRLQGQLVPQLLPAHYPVTLQPVQPNLRHEAGGADAAGGHLRLAEVGENVGEVLEAVLHHVRGVVHQNMNLQLRVNDGHLEYKLVLFSGSSMECVLEYVN